MARTTIIFGALLTLLGVGFFVGIAMAQGAVPSLTALIPAFVGIPILILGVVALKDAYRKHAMHVVSVLALLGLLAPVLRLVMQLSRGAEIGPTVLASLVLMAILCAGLFLSCLKSFIDARRARSDHPD
ncbi:MAG: hypothetical protein H8E44_10640 [Planctomycetes bacterium]|nr:hypothetical protein [Planctomycetota bacterium]MBL7041910.1 hypothetical protein [Pirellulaceae bacterium]